MAKSTKAKVSNGSKEYKNGYSLGRVVASEEVESHYGCNITIEKIETQDGSYRLKIGMHQDPNCGGATGLEVNYPLKSELIELSKAFKRMADNFPESSY